MMQTERITIERTGLMGQGVGKDLSGNIYFVPGAVPGDVVKVGYSDQKKYRDAELLEVLTPSPQRIESPCKHFPECGGCDWIDWDYQSQLKAKQESLLHVLERGDIQMEELLAFRPSPQIFGYRNRIQVRQDGARAGFFKKRSHDLVDITECKIAHPALNEELKKLKTEQAPRRKVELSVNEKGEVTRHENREHATDGFRQINEEQNAFLQELVVSKIREAGSRKVLELFCGNGNLSFPVLPHVEELIGVDSSEPAIESARKLKPEGAKAAFFRDVVDARLLSKMPREFVKSYDTLIVDPPRDGVQWLEEFIPSNVKRILYISCNPVSFSKDVQCLKKNFKLRSVQGIDMFPHTKHIELFAYFERA